MEVDVFTCLKVFGDDKDIAVAVDGVPMTGKGVVESRVDGEVILPVIGDGERVYDVNGGIEFGIDESAARGKATVSAGKEFVVAHDVGHGVDFRFREEGVICPFHEEGKNLRVVVGVEVDFIVDPREAFKRGHGGEAFACSVQKTHTAFFIDVERRFFVEPDEIEVGALKFFT